MNNFKFSTLSIIELGSQIWRKLADDGVEGGADVTIHLPSEDFKRLDEDLYLRNRKSEEDVFEPSEGEINVNIGVVRFNIKEKV